MVKQAIARWAHKILARYGFENWRTIWAYRIVDLTHAE